MADEEKTENETENVEEPPAEEAPASAEETPEATEEAPGEASGDASVETEADSPDPASPGREAEEAGGSDSVEGDQESAGGREAEAAEEILSPKQARKRERSTFAGEARPQRSAEERVSERAAARSSNAANRRRYRQRSRERRRGEGAGTPPANRPPGPKKVRLGKVVSTKADKTITVQIEVVRRHPTYEKVVRRSAKLHAHDAQNAAGEGDTVRIVETRPLSKSKRWRLLEVVEKAR